MNRLCKFKGKQCYLSPIEPEDASIVAGWSNDLDISLKTGDTCHVISVEDQSNFLKNMNNDTSYAFTIIENETHKPIGIVRLMSVDFINRKAELGIFIGDQAYQGKGIGTEAVILMLDFAFNVLNLINIMLAVFSFNLNAQKTYKRLGFKEIGRRRKAVLHGSKSYDLIYMDLLAEDFPKSQILTKLP
jgi:RimJ/RimL family protein N-acetyltransferase